MIKLNTDLDNVLRSVANLYDSQSISTERKIFEEIHKRRVLTPKEVKVKNFFENYLDHFQELSTLTQIVENLDFKGKLQTQGYYNLEGENLEYGKEAKKQIERYVAKVNEFKNNYLYLQTLQKQEFPDSEKPMDKEVKDGKTGILERILQIFRK